MRSTLKLLVPALVASLTLAACGSNSSSSGPSSQAGINTTTNTSSSSSSESVALVKTAANATLNATVLVDAQGMTLYHLSGERNGKFICTSSACLHVWHPLSPSAGEPSGSVGSLATVKRPDGTEQVTYKGTPLYTFTQDQKPGETSGQGIKDVGTWTAVTTGSESSSAPSTVAPTTTPAESAQPENSGGYGY
jgi:predicted lipoprotein with Yx(FWY)xxD motif